MMSKRKDLVRGVLRFDPSVTKQQRDAMAVIVPILFPGKWKSFVLESDSVLEWKYTKDRGEARLDGGKTCRSRPSVLLARGTGFFVFPFIVTRTTRLADFTLVVLSFETTGENGKPAIRDECGVAV